MTTRPFFQVADGPAPDERLGHRAHFDGGYDARQHAGLFEGVLQRQAVDHRRQHAHVVGGGAVHAPGARHEAAEDVAAPDDDGRLDAELLDSFDVFGNADHHGWIHAELLFAHEGFARQLEKDSLVDGG
jgi:hypothetical protein